MSIEKAQELDELKKLEILSQFFNEYAEIFDLYYKEFISAKQIIVEDKGLDVDGMADRIFYEILGVEKNDTRFFDDINDPDSFVLETSDDASYLTQSELDKIPDYTNEFDVKLDGNGNSLHNAILNRVMGIMTGSGTYVGEGMDFNFFQLQQDAPDIYNALIFGIKEGYFSIESEFSHIGYKDGKMKWNMTLEEFNQFIDTPPANGTKTNAENKLFTLLENTSPGSNNNLIPQFTFKLVPGDKLLALEGINTETVNFFRQMKNIGGVPAGVAQGRMNISINDSAVVDSGSLKYLFATLFDLNRAERLALKIDDTALIEIIEEMGYPEQHVYFEWDFINPASADGFATLLNDIRVNTFKSKVFNKFLISENSPVRTLMKHMKAHKIPLTAMVAPGMPHLINLYQRFGAMLLPGREEYKDMNKGLEGLTTTDTRVSDGGSMNDIEVLILPEYIDNPKVITKVFTPLSESIKDARFIQLTSKATWLDSSGKFREIDKGSILTTNQYRYIKKLAKQTGGNIPTKKSLGKYSTDIAKNYMYQRFSQTDLGFIMNPLNIKKELRDSGGNLIYNPALGYEQRKVRYPSIEGWDSNKPTHYSDFYVRLRKAMATTGYEEQFARDLLKEFLGGDYYDNEGKLLAIPANDKGGFIFLNTSNKNADDLWNMLFILRGNKNVLPDVYFDGRIGNVDYTEDVRKKIKNLDKGNITSSTNGAAVARVLDLFNEILPGTTLSEPPSGFPEVSGADLGPGTIYKLSEIAEHNPELLYNLYKKFNATDLFENLPTNIKSNLLFIDSLITMDGIDVFGDTRIDMPDLTLKMEELAKNIKENLQSLEESLGIDVDEIDATVQYTQTEIGQQERATANNANVRSRTGPYSQLLEALNNDDSPAWQNDYLSGGETDVLDRLLEANTNLDMELSSYAVSDGVRFFDLTEYDDYRLAVMGLTQGNSFMSGMNYEDAVDIVNTFVTSDPEHRLYAYKFLQRMDGTTVIPFVNENTKDIFKRNLLIANRILQQGSDNFVMGLSNIDEVTNLPKAQILHLDVAPVKTYPPVDAQGIHILEFDIGMSQYIEYGAEQGTYTRHYTQVAFSFDADTGELRIHHYVDNLPTSDTQSGMSQLLSDALVPQYAVKDSAIIKSLMEIYGITDENKVVDGDKFLPESFGTDGNIPTLRVLPGRIAKSFGFLKVVDDDPDASMYSKTWGETLGSLLRNRRVGVLFGFNERINMPITDAFVEAEELLLDENVRINPVINNPISVQTGITAQPFKNGDISILLNDVLDELQGFRNTQDNMGGVLFENVDLVLKNSSGETINITATMDINGVLRNIMFTSPEYTPDQVVNIINEHLEVVFTPEQLEKARDRNTSMLRDFWLHPTVNPTTGKKEFIKVVDRLNNDEFEVKEVRFTSESTVTFVGDVEDAIDFNNIMRDKNFNFTRTEIPPEGTIDTYNPFLTQVMESEPLTAKPSTTDTGVEIYELQNRNNRLWQNTTSHSSNADSWTHNLYPVGNTGDPNRINYSVNTVNHGDTVNPSNSGYNNEHNGLRRHRRVTPTDIANVAKKSPSIFKLAFKPVGGALRLLEKIDFADKIAVAAIKPVGGLLSKSKVIQTGFKKGFGKFGIAAAGGALAGTAAAPVVGGLLAMYAAAEIGALMVGLVKEGDLFSDTHKLMKELRDDNPGDGAWKRFWTSTGKNVWKGLEWQEDHSLSGYIGKKVVQGVGYGIEEGVGLYNQKYNQNKKEIINMSKYAQNNLDIFDGVNTYNPKYNAQFDSINNNFNMAQQEYGTENYQKNIYNQMNQINNLPLWQKNDELLYNGNEEYLYTVDNYIKLAEEFESIGY